METILTYVRNNSSSKINVNSSMSININTLNGILMIIIYLSL